VGSPSSSETLRERSRRYSAAQRRTITAALDLFAEHGVGGTSFQMIADAVGVTKAAIYHQFKTKQAIAVAVIEVEVAGLEDAVAEAEAQGGSLEAREQLLARVVDAAVERRRAIGALQNDPVMVRILNRDEQSQRMWSRLFSVLLGEDLGITGRVRAAALSAAIGSVGHPFVADLDNETLRTELLRTTRGLIEPAP
jgi:AcrR family transcriptional regulator